MHSLIFDVATSDLMQNFENTTSDLMHFSCPIFLTSTTVKLKRLKNTN